MPNKKRKRCPTDLTWEEENPTFYLFNKQRLEDLKVALKNFKERIERNNAQQ